MCRLSSRLWNCFFLVALAWLIALPATAAAEEEAKPTSSPAAKPSRTPPEDEHVIPAPKLPDPAGAKKLPKPDEVWVDAKAKQVMVDGYVSLRKGYLEMFACLQGTKEHESVVAVRTRAKTVHAALLAVGAVPGTPVQFRPEFKPPTGTVIDVEVRWLDDAGKWKSAKAQQWIRNTKTKKPMTQPFVFAGSIFEKNEATGREIYMAEAGDFICVSNFATAMLDVPFRSSDSNDQLQFEANTEQIPILGTPVRLVLTPKLEKGNGQPGKASDTETKQTSPGENTEKK